MTDQIRPSQHQPTLPGGDSLFARLRRCRRGAIAIGFGVSVIGFLGLAGLATEVGYWYMVHRRAQNAADAAALAGAKAFAKNSNATYAVNTATYVATSNGFTTGVNSNTVTVPSPPVTCGSYTTAVRATVAQAQVVSFSRLFSPTATTVTTSACAAIVSSGPACVLALTYKLDLSGSFRADATDCVFASNSTRADAIEVGGSSDIRVKELHSAGGCSGCTNSGNVTPGTPYVAYGEPTKNPFSGLDGASWPVNGSSTCAPSIPTSNGTTVVVEPYENNGNMPICSDFQLQNTDVYQLRPGTYFLWEADFKMTGGSLTCPTCTATNGVSIVLLGRSGHVGDFDMTGGVAVLNAGNSNSTNSDLAGVLIYRQYDGDHTGPGASGEVTINGGTGTGLSGGFYFPGAAAKYNGNSATSCTVIVGGQITMNGSGTFTTSGCSSIGTETGDTQWIALVQ